MELFYFHDPKGNFGDDMNTWIWDDLLPGWTDWRADSHLVGIGTILNTQLDLPKGHKLVMGSGTGYGTTPPLEPAEMWDVRCVRGPRSAALLGLPEALGIVDPAMMSPRLPRFADLEQGAVTPSDTPIFIPHCSNDTRHDWDAICGALGMRYVTPRGDADSVIREIATAPLVVAESMHAAILADAFRTPWIATSVSGNLNYPKWADWADSLGIDLQVHEMFPEFSQAIGLLRKLRGKRPAAPASASPSQAPHAAAGPSTTSSNSRKKLRHNLEKPLIKARMKRALQQPSSLSDPARLAECQARFQTVLDQVIAEYRS